MRLICSPSARLKSSRRSGASADRRCTNVVVRTHQTGGQIQIEISDDGRGIDAGRVLDRAVSLGLVDATDARALSERDALDMMTLASMLHRRLDRAAVRP